ncbi:MAG: AAA family ATPase [Archaeoglobaceae archaeon]|nr:AAA family ATPase [Archaeoglobaceae archaeon]MDW8128805.1 AAA family ATPase [Archaeoglobaceae archaeon]
MKITISGPPGSGKTTVAKILSEKLKIKLISAGEVFRQLAFDRGMSLEEFSKFAESNPEIDIMIDKLQRELAEKEKDVIVEGRLSGWMIKDADLRVYIFADPEVRYSRIAKRESKDLSTVKRETKLREEIEKRRYQKFYSIDIDDWKIYDLVVNSNRISAEKIAELIALAIK